MTFTAVVTAHEVPPFRILGNLIYQTRKPDEIIVFGSDIDPADREALEEGFPYVAFHWVENRNDWGHEKRSQGLDLATGEWIGWFNHDDDYDSTYVEKLLDLADEHDVVYCAWNRIPDCVFGGCSSTSGNFIVRVDKAREVGGWQWRDYAADAWFINALVDGGARVARVDETLYFWNEVLP